MSDGPYRRELPHAAVAALLALLVGWSFHQRWAVLDATPYPVGIDGYFYAIQLRSLLDGGALAYPASPLAFWLMAPFALATDPIVGAKLGAAFWGALIAVPAYGVGARLGGGRGAGLVAAALATVSAGSMYATLEFVKNSIGLTVALTAVWLLLRALERPDRGRVAAAALGLAAALATHKLAAGLARWPRRSSSRPRSPRSPRPARAGPSTTPAHGVRRRHLAALAAVALVLGLLFPQRFPSPADVDLVAGAVHHGRALDRAGIASDRATLAMGHEA
ncbi:MAG: glycosyltransferase family 39 protein [Deltaproteobacteria bacterium]|nr:glycosyltransferase family 39 protein [Deltaproteobacteria bacterium]